MERDILGGARSKRIFAQPCFVISGWTVSETRVAAAKASRADQKVSADAERKRVARGLKVVASQRITMAAHRRDADARARPRPAAGAR